MALFTALAFGAIPFAISYRPVAFGAIWDLIIAAFYGVAFGLMRGMNGFPSSKNDWHNYALPQSVKEEVTHNDIRIFERDSYILIAGTILFLTSAIMGAALICLGRRSARGGFSLA